jgi:hypothetical protein
MSAMAVKPKYNMHLSPHSASKPPKAFYQQSCTITSSASCLECSHPHVHGSIRASPPGHKVPIEGDDGGNSSGKYLLVSAFAPPNVMYFEDVTGSTRGYGSRPTGQLFGLEEDLANLDQ